MEGENMQQNMEDFRSQVIALQAEARAMNISEKTIGRYFEEVFANNENQPLAKQKSALISFTLSILRMLFSTFIVFLKIIMSFALLYAVASFHNPTQKMIMRNSQNLIYPFMRSVRLSTLHLIRNYDSITEWHEEECLLSNPLYQEPPLDCWPCEDVRNLVDLTGLQNYSKAYCSNEKPFIVKDVMTSNATIDLLREMYLKYQEELEKGTAMYVSNNPHLHNLQSLWKHERRDKELKQPDLHILWKVNRVMAAQIVRKIFKRPYFVPSNSEVALQKFLYIDGPESAPYSMPMTDFADVWVAQGQGSRILVLEPSTPCQRNCSSITVLLNPGYVVYYNWQFWRPRSLPTRLSEEPSLTFVGSFY